MWTEGDTGRADRAVARLAAAQHGVLTRRQLLEAGLLSSGIAVRLDADRLHRIHRGVYAVGHANLGSEGRWMAAVLACGGGAVLSHLSAAALWDIDPRGRRLSMSGGRGHRGPIHVTVPRTTGMRKRHGIALHRSRTLSAADCTRRTAIPVTTPARTLRDLHRVLPRHVFVRMVREAEFLGLPLGGIETDHTRSELETRFLALLRRHRLPQPEVNVRIDRFVVDLLWRAEGVVVELDGWEGHRGRAAFEEDRARDARLKVLGYEVVRFTWLQVSKRSQHVVTTLRSVLAR